ncbi:MAG TPA: S8 family serine peptidase [Solirubrobacterales bacterium]
MLALTCAFSPTTGVAANRPSYGDLSPRLAELAKPSVRSAPPAKQAEELSLASEGPGSLLREGNRVLVEVRFDRGATAAVDDLRATGAKIVNVSPRYQTVTVAAKPAALPALSGVPRVAGATEVLTPFTAESTCPSGVEVSEGDAQLRADEVREPPFSVNGSGVTVGILSDSFHTATKSANGAQPIATKAAKDVETGDLPGETNTCSGQTAPVNVLEDYEPSNADEPEPGDEGRGMAQIVHDLAPGAGLAFATAFTGETAFAENIEKLAEPGPEGAEASVIADDVSYPAEPFFQEGPVGVAVSKVAGEGVTYFSAAGNNNLFDADGNEIGSWEAQQYRDSGSCPPAVASLAGFHGTHCLDFNPGAQADKTYGIKVAAGATLTVDLQWDEPWLGVNSDFDAFLLNSTGGLIGVAAGDNIEISQKPVEVLQWPNKSGSQQTVQLVVNRFAGGTPRLKFALLENGSGVTAVEYPRSTGTDVVGPTIFGHNGAADAVSLGAVPFDSSAEAEEYSSRGPVTHYFGPVNGATVAEPLSSAEVLSKPDIAATDCGRTTFFASFSFNEGVWRFCGTSAAAPHAAAVAALMSEAEPLAGPEEIRAAMLASAVPVGEFGGCAVGTGLVDAVGAVEDVNPPAEPSCPVPTSEGSVEEARAPGNWGIEALPPSPPQPPIDNTPPPEPPPVDNSPPDTSLRKKPAKVVRTTLGNATAVFVFGSDESRVTFLCRVDQGPWRTCPARFVRRYRVGKHVVRVVARDAAGNSDPTAVVYSFRVKRVG